MSRLLVLGSPRFREILARQLEQLPDTEVVECDPALGDCVMYVRLESVRYDAFFFVGFDHAVTRGALAVVADRAVLIPLLEGSAPEPLHDGYLFRLPKALGFRDDEERTAILSTVPNASAVPHCLIGRAELDAASLSTLVSHATHDRWQWEGFVDEVGRTVTEGPSLG